MCIRDRFHGGPQDQFQRSRHDRAQDGPSTSRPHHDQSSAMAGLLASDQSTEPTNAEADEDWVSLINPHLMQEEREEFSSDDGDSEREEEDTDGKSVEGEETQSFLELAFQKTATLQQRKKWLEKFPRPTSSCVSPPTINKPIYSLIQTSLSQTKKKVLSHDRFLVKLQPYASDAAGPLTYLLSELQAGKPVPADKALQAVQTALCCVGNTFAHLSVERRKGILQHLNKQLVPMAEEDFPNDGTLFGPKFGKKAKDRVDAIKSLASSSSVFFRLGDPPGRSFKGQGSRGKGPDRFTPYNKKGGNSFKWSKPSQQTRSAPKK